MAIVEVNIDTGVYSPAKKGDFTIGMYENARGAHKQFSWIASLVDIAASFFDSVKDSGILLVTKPIAKAAQIAAPLCAMPEALTNLIKSFRSYVDLTADCSAKKIEKAFGYSVKFAQRTAESVAGLMKMGILDATMIVGAKFFKDGFACVIDVLTMKEAGEKDLKIAKIADRKLKEISETENHFVFMKGIVGFAFHAMNIAGLLCAAAVTMHMVVGLATVYTFTVLSAAWFAIEREDLENQYALEIANGARVAFSK